MQLACVLLAGTAACRGPGPASAGLLARLQEAQAPAGALRQKASVELAADALTGHYTAALIARRGPLPAARVQLLPAVGGKLLDLAINPERLAGYFPAAGIRVEHERGKGPVPRHLLTFLAASVLEQLSPMASRVRGVLRRGEDFTTLELDGVLEGCRVQVDLDSRLRVIERRYRLRHVRWVERVFPDRREFRGKGFGWILRNVEEEPLADPADALFDLELPPERT